MILVDAPVGWISINGVLDDVRAGLWLRGVDVCV